MIFLFPFSVRKLFGWLGHGTWDICFGLVKGVTLFFLWLPVEASGCWVMGHFVEFFLPAWLDVNVFISGCNEKRRLPGWDMGQIFF